MATKKTTTKKPAAKKAPAKKPAAAVKKPAANKSAETKVPAKKPTAKKAPAKRPATVPQKKPADANVGDTHEKVQLWEGGPYWATTNIGAEKPEDYGYYFWRGDTVGYKRENDKWVATDGSDSDFWFDDAEWIEDDVLAPEHDAAHVQWGGDWRMPTKEELEDLCEKCDWTWKEVNGVQGYVVCGRGDYASASIFLPAADHGEEDMLCDAGANGYYWSSVRGPGNDYAWCLSFFSIDYSTLCNYCRHMGQPVRPVQGFTK